MSWKRDPHIAEKRALERRKAHEERVKADLKWYYFNI
jgi:hypothetical protein